MNKIVNPNFGHKCRVNDLELLEYLMDHSDFENTVRLEDDGISATFRKGAAINVNQYARHTNRSFEVENGEIFFPSNNKIVTPKQRMPILRWLRSLGK